MLLFRYKSHLSGAPLQLIATAIHYATHHSYKSILLLAIAYLKARIMADRAGSAHFDEGSGESGIECINTSLEQSHEGFIPPVHEEQHSEDPNPRFSDVEQSNGTSDGSRRWSRSSEAFFAHIERERSSIPDTGSPVLSFEELATRHAEEPEEHVFEGFGERPTPDLEGDEDPFADSAEASDWVPGGPFNGPPGVGRPDEGSFGGYSSQSSSLKPPSEAHECLRYDDSDSSQDDGQDSEAESLRDGDDEHSDFQDDGEGFERLRDDDTQSSHDDGQDSEPESWEDGDDECSDSWDDGEGFERWMDHDSEHSEISQHEDNPSEAETELDLRNDATLWRDYPDSYFISRIPSDQVFYGFIRLPSVSEWVRMRRELAEYGLFITQASVLDQLHRLWRRSFYTLYDPANILGLSSNQRLVDPTGATMPRLAFIERLMDTFRLSMGPEDSEEVEIRWRRADEWLHTTISPQAQRTLRILNALYLHSQRRILGDFPQVFLTEGELTET